MHSPSDSNATLTKEEEKLKKKKVAAKEWIITILESDKDISLDELIYQLRNAVGLIDRSLVLECLTELDIKKYSSQET